MSLVGTTNERSANLARRLGYTPAETRVIEGFPCIVFEHPLLAG